MKKQYSFLSESFTQKKEVLQLLKEVCEKIHSKYPTGDALYNGLYKVYKRTGDTKILEFGQKFKGTVDPQYSNLLYASVVRHKMWRAILAMIGIEIPGLLLTLIGSLKLADAIGFSGIGPNMAVGAVGGGLGGAATGILAGTGANLVTKHNLNKMKALNDPDAILGYLSK